MLGKSVLHIAVAALEASPCSSLTESSTWLLLIIVAYKQALVQT
jgi:hypothetical protein